MWFELTRDSRIDEELTVYFESEVFGNFEATFAARSDRVENIELSLPDDAIDSGTRPYEIKIAENANYVPSGKTSLAGTAVDNDWNSPPVAYDLSFVTDEDTVAAEGFLIPPAGYDNQQWDLSYQVVEQPSQFGTVTFDEANGWFVFTPHEGVFEHLNDGDYETVSFEYVANDGAGGVSDPATVQIKVGGVSDSYVAPTISIGDVTVSEAQPEDGSGQFAIVKITLSEPSTRDVAVNYAIVGGTATAYEDYSPASWTAYIPAGETETEIAIPIWEDTAVEESETIEVVLSNPVNAVIGDGGATVTITDDDQEGGGGVDPGTGAPGVKVTSLNNIEVEEGGKTDTLTVVLTSKPTEDVTVPLYRDFGITISANSLTFTPENWDQPQTVTITAEDDTDVEGDHTAMVYFGEATSEDPDYSGLWPNMMDEYVYITDNDEAGNTAPSVIDVAADTYDTDLSVDVAGFGYDMESSVTYEVVSQPAEGTVTVLPDGKFHFEGNAELLAALSRGEVKPVTFQYQVVDDEGLASAPAKITINVHGTNPGDETIQAFTRTTPSQTDFFPLDGGDGNDTVVFNSVTLTSGTGLEISLGKTIKWTEYAGKPIVNIENITIKNTKLADLARTMTVGGDGQANVITIENTNHNLFVNGGGGNDTINFKGAGNGLNSVVNGGAGDDTVNARSAVVVNVADGNDTVNVFNGGNVTVENFGAGDKLNFAAAGIQAGNVTVAEAGGNTVFTINQNGATSTVTVKGKTGLQSGTDWTAEGVQTPVDQTPVAVDDAASTTAGAPVTINVLANDTDADGGPKEVASFTQAANGTVTQDGANITYTPNAGFGGTDTFTYALNGGDEATVTVTVEGDAQDVEPPVAVNDTATAAAGQPITIDVLGNDTDADGGAKTIASFEQPANGVVAQTEDGRLVYTPNASFVGTDTFTYTVNGGSAAHRLGDGGGRRGGRAANAHHREHDESHREQHHLVECHLGSRELHAVWLRAG